MKKQNLTLLILLTTFLLIPSLRAETIDPDKKSEYPYQVVEIGDKIFRFDKRTGRLEPLLISDVPAHSEKEQLSGEKPRDRALSTPQPPRNKPPIFLNIDGEDTEDPVEEEGVPTHILDKHRDAAKADLAKYRLQLGLIQTVHVSGDTIAGTLAVTNKGDRKLQGLELTLLIPSNTGDVKQRYVLSYLSGHDRPPQPAKKEGSRPEPVFIKVECPAPAGLKGKIDTEVSYIKFAQD